MMGVLIDLNTVNEDEEDNYQNTQNFQDQNFNLSPQNPSSSVCMELWHACAGPLISLPKKGSLVVYLPQGHLEEQQHNNMPEFDFSCGVNSSNNIHNHNTFDSHHNNIPPHVFCRVLDVKLHVSSLFFNATFFFFIKFDGLFLVCS